MALVADRRITLPAGTKGFTIWGLFDVHADSRDCDHVRLNRYITEIKNDPMARVIVGGDFNDMMFAKGDPRFAPSVLRLDLLDKEDPADCVVKMNADILSPIKDRIDAYLCGNHEANYTDRHKTDVAKRTAELLGVPYLGYCGFLRHYVARDKTAAVRTLTGYLHHGYGAGAPVTKGAITLNRLRGMVRADYVMTGHIHTGIAIADPQLEPKGNFGNGYIHEVPFLAAVCGTMKKSLSVGPTATYAEMKGHSPAPLHPGKLNVEMKRNIQRENGKPVEEAIGFKLSFEVTCG